MIVPLIENCRENRPKWRFRTNIIHYPTVQSYMSIVCMPINNNERVSKRCICQSDKAFEQCCDRFLNQGQFAKTPEQLMRSRFSAFALGGYGEYLLATWLPEQVSGMTAAELSVKSTEWLGLEIVSKSQKGEIGFVEFKAVYLNINGDQEEHHEYSEFARRNKRWWYVAGQIK